MKPISPWHLSGHHDALEKSKCCRSAACPAMRHRNPAGFLAIDQSAYHGSERHSYIFSLAPFSSFPSYQLAKTSSASNSVPSCAARGSSLRLRYHRPLRRDTARGGQRSFLSTRWCFGEDGILPGGIEERGYNACAWSTADKTVSCQTAWWIRLTSDATQIVNLFGLNKNDRPD